MWQHLRLQALQGDAGLVVLLNLVCLRKGVMRQVSHTSLDKTNTTRVWEAACLTPAGTAVAELDPDCSLPPATVRKQRHAHAQDNGRTAPQMMVISAQHKQLSCVRVTLTHSSYHVCIDMQWWQASPACSCIHCDRPPSSSCQEKAKQACPSGL